MKEKKEYTCGDCAYLDFYKMINKNVYEGLCRYIGECLNQGFLMSRRSDKKICESFKRRSGR